MKHLKGPWRLGKFSPFGMYLTDTTTTEVIGSIFAGDETDSRGPSTVVGHMVDKPDLANARLIAAAPDLLEACEAALMVLDSPAFSPFLDGPRISQVDRLRQAIRLAKGAK